VWTVLTSTTGFTTGFSVAWGGRGYTLVPGDYDGDRRADLGLYERATGSWFVLTSAAGFTTAISRGWGGAGYLPVPGDYDGDGKVDLGVYQQATGNWYVLRSSSNYSTTLQVTGWGAEGDVPISTAIPVGINDLLRAGDFDGDMRSEITVYNVTTGLWASLTSSTGFTGATNRIWGGSMIAPGDYDGDGRGDLVTFERTRSSFEPTSFYVTTSSTLFTKTIVLRMNDLGLSADPWVPAPGDYDGDGKTDFVMYNPPTHSWVMRLSGEGYAFSRSFSYGSGDAVPADYDGDGKTDVATYDGATGHWSVRLSSTNDVNSQMVEVGGPGWMPMAADYDGDGRADFVVYNTSTGQWYGLLSSANYTTTINVAWGGTGYTPAKGDYDGDGKADLALYVASTGNWYVLLSGRHYTTTMTSYWGGPGYAPVPQ
jgi:hypothetical protein